MRTAVHRLKYQGRRELGPVLGRMLAAFVREAPALGEADLVVPVPLHASRERERGFNPALLLAAAVAEALDLPLLPSGLERTVPTAPQSALGLRQRWANVAGAFSVPATGAGMVRGRAVLLVDDVMTSGATAAECAAALRRAGAGRVAVVTLARATPPEARPRVEEDRPEAGESRPQSAGSRTAAAAEGAAQGQPPEGQRLLRGTMAPGAAGGGGRPGAVRAGRP
ncbi:MAG: phosphoribosyltransferase family protein [Armatimonadota bacterium]|nr:phosphoribosyltransferase family protein [Armatimonadota bacterium]MDR7427854.1 phosphoribosyltransferase family protein [Armatimonadota bacterium]MDR7465029.1 phosphoribosyltransferase family protein [Armatimonadota bacterium]MDR7475318.1 phosphoribosyltransferase family protein [Armatimonadota bacterium]MDR7539949.1 phosphoribosyltransferase family protein [Armatimonadota bacterium]